jgi:hypothetical protein
MPPVINRLATDRVVTGIVQITADSRQAFQGMVFDWIQKQVQRTDDAKRVRVGRLQDGADSAYRK